MKFVNLTPHALTIEGLGTIPANGQVARVGTTRVTVGTRGGVRVVAQNLGQVEGLPTPEADTVYIVSGMVLDAIKRQVQPGGQSRAGDDVFSPDTGPDCIRQGGHIVAVRGLVC